MHSSHDKNLGEHFAVIGAGRVPAAQRMRLSEVPLAHQPCDTMLTAGLSSLSQIEKDPRGPVNSMTRSERRPNQAKQPGVLLRPV